MLHKMGYICKYTASVFQLSSVNDIWASCISIVHFIQCAACQVTVRPFGIYFLILTGRLYITPHIKDLRRLGWAIQYNGNFCNIWISCICYEHLCSEQKYSGLGLKYSGLSDPTILLVGFSSPRLCPNHTQQKHSSYLSSTETGLQISGLSPGQLTGLDM